MMQFANRRNYSCIVFLAAIILVVVASPAAAQGP